MEIHPNPIDSLNDAFAGLSRDYETIIRALREKARSKARLRPVLAGAEILDAQHDYFFPIEESLEPHEFRVLHEALELEAEWLASKAALLCPVHPTLAIQMLRLADSSLSLIPAVSQAWLWSEVTETPVVNTHPSGDPHKVAA